jgi:hypothetical protein
VAHYADLASGIQEERDALDLYNKCYDAIDRISAALDALEVRFPSLKRTRELERQAGSEVRAALRHAQSLCVVRAPTVEADRRRNGPKFQPFCYLEARRPSGEGGAPRFRMLYRDADGWKYKHCCGKAGELNQNHETTTHLPQSDPSWWSDLCAAGVAGSAAGGEGVDEVAGPRKAG